MTDLVSSHLIILSPGATSESKLTISFRGLQQAAETGSGFDLVGFENDWAEIVV
jgi:hypothetical protein